MRTSDDAGGHAAPAFQGVPALRRGATNPEITDLVARYARADRDAARAAASLARLVALCQPVAERIAGTYAARGADVDDIVQDVQVALASDLPRLRTPAAFPRWFATLVHNRCRDWLRRERAHGAARWSATPRPGWLGPSEGNRPGDIPDADAARALLRLDARDELRRLLAPLAPQQREALTLAYLEDRSHEEIGRTLGVSPRAAEGLVYRALRRLQTVAAQCADEPEELGLWCPYCGERRILAQLLPGTDAGAPLLLRCRCPRCTPAGAWMNRNPVPLARYPTLEEACWRNAHASAAFARRLARTARPACPRCAAPLARSRGWRPRPDPASGPALLTLFWECPNCARSGDGLFFGHLAMAAAVDEWLPLWRTAPRLVLEEERLVRMAGEEQVVLTASDPDARCRATVAVACDALALRRFEVAWG